MQLSSASYFASIVALLITTLATSACVSTRAPASVGLTAQSENVVVDSSDVATQVDALTRKLLLAIEWRADQIRSLSDDPDVRRHALLWKINGSGAILGATSHSDPLVSVLDVWTLVLQFRDFFETGPGAEMFGEHVAIAHEFSSLAVADLERLVGRIALAEGVARGRQIVAEFAAREPITNEYLLRFSVASEVVPMLVEERRDVFANLGSISQTVESLGSRLSIFMEHLPKQAGWQAELLLEDSTTEGRVGGVFEDVASISAAADRIAGTIDHAVDSKLDEILSRALAQIATELDDVETLVNSQRQLVLEELPSEYERIFEYVTAQRTAALAQVETKIDEALDRVDQVADRSLGSAEVLTRDTVDYALARAVPVMLGTFVGLLILLLVYRFVPSESDRIDRTEPVRVAVVHETITRRIPRSGSTTNRSCGADAVRWATPGI